MTTWLNNALWGAPPPSASLGFEPIGDVGSIGGSLAGDLLTGVGNAIPATGSSFFNWPSFLAAIPSGSPSGGTPPPDTDGGGAGFPFSLAGSASRLGSALARMAGLGDVSSGLGGAGSLFNLAGGIASGNPFQAGSGALGSYGALSNLFPNTVPSLGSLVGASALPSAGSLAATEAGIGLGAGEMGANAAGAGLGLGGGMLAGVAAMPFTIALGNWIADMMGSGPGVANKQSAMAHDTSQIRKAFATAWPQLEQGGQLFGALPGIEQLPDDQEIAALKQALTTSTTGIGAFPAVSQFLATGGGQHTDYHGFSVPPVDTSAYTPRYWPLLVGSTLGQLAAEDRLAQLGVDPSTVFQGGYPMLQRLGWLSYLDPAAGGGQGTLFGPEGTTEYWGPGSEYRPVPQAVLDALAMPGQRLSTIQDFFSGLDPDFATSPLGQMFSTLGPYMTGAVSPETQAAMQASQQAYQSQLAQDRAFADAQQAAMYAQSIGAGGA